MNIYSVYKAYISRTNKIVLNTITIVLAILSLLLSKDESLFIFPIAVEPIVYVSVAGVMDFFQFGGVLSKKGNIPESILCAFKGKELLVKAVISDRLAHLIRLFVIVLPTLILADSLTPGKLFVIVASWLGAFLAVTILNLITRVLSLTFQISMLVAYLMMIPLSVIAIIPSVVYTFGTGDMTIFFAAVSVVYALLGIGFSVLQGYLAGSTYRYKFADIH
jgi:hypothetical protein